MRSFLRTISLASSLSALATFASAQSAALPQVRSVGATWSRTFDGGFPNERVLDLRQLGDGSLRVAGRSGSFGSGAAGGWLLSLTLAAGDLRFNRLVGRPTTGGVDGAGLAADGGALFTGRDVIDLFLKHDAWVVRVDAAGNVQWSQGFTRPGAGRHFLADAAELSDGSWIAAGATSEIDQPPQAAWLVKLSPAGALQWQFEYGAGVSEWIQSVVPTADGGFAVAGWTTSSGAGAEDAFVMKLDGSGAIQWQRTIGSADSDAATEIVELAAGGYAVAGWTNGFTSSGHAPWVLRLGASGQLLWHAVVGDQVWGDLDGVGQSSDGDVIAFGRVGEPGFQTNDLWAAELSSSTGAIEWQRAYAGDSGDWGSQVLALSGGELLFGGEWASGFPEEDLWMLRTDRYGHLDGCGLERKTLFAATSPAVLAQAGVAVRTPGGAQLQPAAFALAAGHPDVAERCSTH